MRKFFQFILIFMVIYESRLAMLRYRMLWCIVFRCISYSMSCFYFGMNARCILQTNCDHMGSAVITYSLPSQTHREPDGLLDVGDREAVRMNTSLDFVSSLTFFLMAERFVGFVTDWRSTL